MSVPTWAARLSGGDKLTWTCHFCGDVRPDEQIGVVSKLKTIVGVTMKENRRYCLDRGECEARALAWKEHA